jgi:hypothetical protein
MAACTPPIRTVTWALAKRLSAETFSIESAVSWSSQKAWMLTRGTERARGVPTGTSGARVKATPRLAVALNEYAASPPTVLSPNEWESL